MKRLTALAKESFSILSGLLSAVLFLALIFCVPLSLIFTVTVLANHSYALLPAAAAAVVTATGLLRSLVKGRGPEHRQLLRVAVPLLLLLILRFGGTGVLSLLHMGWRCAPRNLMDMLLKVLILLTIWRGLYAYTALPAARKRFEALICLCSAITALFVIGSICFSLICPVRDWPSVQDHQQIVVEDDGGGGTIGLRTAYLYVNSLVHGPEIEYKW